jgi:uncharacterized membrane protein
LSVLKESDADGRIELKSAAVVERTDAGQLQIADSADNVGLVGTASGSLIGMLVGVLGGPVGLLLGWGAGALVGGSFDLDREEESDEALGVLGRAISPGSSALIADVTEPEVELIDAKMDLLGGEVTRRSVVDVVAELGLSARSRRGGRTRGATDGAREAQSRDDGRPGRTRGQAEGEAAYLLTASGCCRWSKPVDGRSRASTLLRKRREHSSPHALTRSRRRTRQA